MQQSVRVGDVEVPIVRVCGDARSCGRQYGASVRPLIEKSLATYLDAYRHHHGLSRDGVYKLAAEYESTVAAYDLAALEEMRGIAEGSGLPLKAILALNARSELVYGLKARAQDGCTSFAVVGDATRDGRVLIGQNWDWKPAVRASTVLLAVAREGDPAVLTLTEAGLLGKIGLNAAGVGVVVNFLLSDQRSLGVPVHVIRRRALSAWTLADAVGAVLNADRALAANYLFAHADGEAIDLEASPGDVNVLSPQDGVLVHANHFRGAPPVGGDLGRRIFPDSLLRDQRLGRLLARQRGKLDVSACQVCLRDHFGRPDSICRHSDTRDPQPDQIETVGSVVMDLSERVMHVCFGPPCEGDYVAVPLEAA